MKAQNGLKMVLLLVCYVLIMNQNKVNGENWHCGGKEILLSANRTIAPFELVTVSKNVTSPANLDYTRVYNFGYDQYLDAWCSDIFDTLRQVELGFTTPILITAMVSGGRIESSTSIGSSSYVSRFTLEYSSVEDSSIWKTYTTSDLNIKQFLVPEINTFFKLDTPILTQGIRLRILEWIDDANPPGSDFQFICQGVALYGCLASEAIEDTDSQLLPATEDTDSQLLPAPENSDSSDLHVLIALLVITLLIVIILVVVVIVLGYKLTWTRRELIKQSQSVYARLERVPQSSFTHESKIVRRFVEPKATNTTVEVSRGKIDIYSSESLNYESVESKASEKDTQERQCTGGAGVISHRLDPISETSGEYFTSLTRNCYELVESRSTLNRTLLIPTENVSQMGDSSSLTYNSAYNSPESMSIQPGQAVDVVKGDGEVEDEEPYEAMVRLQRNTSYSYVQGEPLATPRGPDYYNTTPPSIVIDTSALS